MTARLGRVIYWACCIFAMLWDLWGSTGMNGPAQTAYMVAVIGPSFGDRLGRSVPYLQDAKHRAHASNGNEPQF